MATDMMREIATMITAGQRKPEIIAWLTGKGVKKPVAQYNAAVDELRAIGAEDYRVQKGAILLGARQLYGQCLTLKDAKGALKALKFRETLLAED